MIVFATGLDEITTAFLRTQLIKVEQQQVSNPADLLNWLQGHYYDVAMVNLAKMGLDIDFCRGFRASGLVTPIIGVSTGVAGRLWSVHRATFLENGGDDLFRPPVNLRELIATLRAVSRRFRGSLLDVLEYRSGDATLKVNMTTLSIQINESIVPLRGRELSVLFLLASSPGRLLTQSTILDHMCIEDIEDKLEMRLVDVLICKLRRRLISTHPHAAAFIETVRGSGYRLPTQSELSKRVEAA